MLWSLAVLATALFLNKWQQLVPTGPNYFWITRVHREFHFAKLDGHLQKIP